MRYLIVLLILSGCASAPAPPWTKSGGTADGLAKDHYRCLQEAQYTRPTIPAPKRGEFGSAGAGLAQGFSSARSGSKATDHRLYNACMNAAGWTR